MFTQEHERKIGAAIRMMERELARVKPIHEEFDRFMKEVMKPIREERMRRIREAKK